MSSNSTLNTNPIIACTNGVLLGSLPALAAVRYSDSIVQHGYSTYNDPLINLGIALGGREPAVSGKALKANAFNTFQEELTKEIDVGVGVTASYGDSVAGLPPVVQVDEHHNPQTLEAAFARVSVGGPERDTAVLESLAKAMEGVVINQFERIDDAFRAFLSTKLDAVKAQAQAQERDDAHAQVIVAMENALDDTMPIAQAMANEAERSLILLSVPDPYDASKVTRGPDGSVLSAKFGATQLNPNSGSNELEDITFQLTDATGAPISLTPNPLGEHKVAAACAGTVLMNVAEAHTRHALGEVFHTEILDGNAGYWKAVGAAGLVLNNIAFAKDGVSLTSLATSSAAGVVTHTVVLPLTRYAISSTIQSLTPSSPENGENPSIIGFLLERGPSIVLDGSTTVLSSLLLAGLGITTFPGTAALAIPVLVTGSASIATNVYDYFGLETPGMSWVESSGHLLLALGSGVASYAYSPMDTLGASAGAINAAFSSLVAGVSISELIQAATHEDASSGHVEL